MATAWHVLKQLNCLVAVHSIVVTTLSRRHIRSSLSDSPLNPLLSSISFLSQHNIVRHQWLAHIHMRTIHAADANFCTSSSSSSSFAVKSLDAPVPPPATYRSVLIHCRRDAADMLAEALLCFGASSVTMDQHHVCQNSNEISMSSIFLEGDDINTNISNAADSIGLKEIPRYEIKINKDDDWMISAQESFRPTEVKEGIWVVPQWITPPDVQATNIFLNPGLAFGTGDHPTTKLCLLLLHDCIRGGEYILDYGTGTGILAIAALKFGAAFAVGIDVDSQAIASASQNASLNNIGSDKLKLHLVGDDTSSSSSVSWPFEVVEGENACANKTVTEKDKYDVVIANILLNPLLDLADHIISCAKPGAVIGLSGILHEQVQYIIQRYSPFLESIEVSRMDDWACVSGRKKVRT